MVDDLRFFNCYAWVDPFCFLTPDQKVDFRCRSLFPDPCDSLFDFYGG